MSGISVSGGGLEEAHALGSGADLAPRPEGSRRSDERFLLELGELLRVSGSSSQLLYDVATLLAGHLGVSRSLFAEVDGPNRRAIIHRDFHGDLPSMAGPLPFEPYSHENLAALRAGRVVVNCDAASDPRTASRYAGVYRPAGIRASVAAPLFLDGRWVSTLYVSTSEPRVWEAREVALIQSVAERTWMTVEHLRAVAALRRSEARKAAILASALDAILSIDHRGQVLEFNPAAERMFGRRGDDAVGRSLTELLDLPQGPDDSPDLARLLDVNGGMLGTLIELPAIRADGSRFPAEVAMAAVVGVMPPLFTATLRDITERKRSAEQFRLAVEASPTGMAMADAGGRLVLTNPEVERIFGYERGELIGRSIDQLVPDPAPRSAGTGRDRRGMRKDGSLVAIEMTSNPLVTAEGVFALSSVVDVTQRERLEAEREALVRELRELSRNLEARIAERTQELAVAHATLSRSEANFRAVIETAPDGILVHRWGPIVYANPALLRSLGYHDRDALVARPVAELVHPHDRDDVLARMGRLRKRDVPSELHEIRLLDASGAGCWVEVSAIPIEFDGEPAVLVMFRDVTERRKVESVLRESEARYRALFDDSPTPLWEEDFSEVAAYLDGLLAGGVTDLRAYLHEHPEAVAAAAAKVRILSVNQSALDMYEARSASELLRGLPQLFGPETFDVFREELFAFLDGRTTYEGETRTRTLGGRPNDASFRLNVVSGHERDWSRVVVSVFDLTRHKAAEKQIRSSLREKEVLLKEVHHRVKNNLQVISSLLSLQAQHLADPAARAMFGESQGRVRSIALVHEKLYQARDLSHIRFDEYTRELVEDLLHSLGGPGRSIDARIDVDGVTMAVTTAIPCGLIVNELVTNSLKHAFPPPRGGTIRVGLRACGDDRLELIVEDDGTGLPAGLDPRRTSSLGLDLVYTFAQQLEADVTVRRGCGTGFSFVFRSTGGSG